MAKDYLKSVLGIFDNAKELARQKAEEARRRAAEAARQRAQQAQSFVRSIPQKARDFNEITVDERNAGRNKLVSMGFKPTKPAATQGIKITDAIRDTSKNVAQDFGNFFRNSNFGGKRVQPVMNMVGNTAETVGSGVSGATMNIMNFAQKPSATNLVRQGAGLVYNVAKPIAAGTPFFTAANIASQTPQGGKLDAVSRVSAGLMRGQTGVKTLAPDVEERKQKILGMEFDPATAGGEMLGFVKNPVNKKLFAATEKISPKWFLRASGSPAAQQALGKIENFIAKNAVRGSIEDIMMSLDELPEDASLQEQAKYIVEKGLWGAVSENVGQGFFKGSEAVMKGAADVATKGLDQIEFKPVMEFLENVNILRKTTGETPKVEAKGPRSAEDIIRDAQGRFAVKGAEPQMSRVEMLARDPNTNLADLSPQLRKQVNEFRFTEMGISAGGKLPGEGKLVERPDGTGMEQRARSRLSQPASAAYGFAGGIEPVYDENGKPTGEVRYNAEKGMAGFFAAGALQSKAGKQIVEEGLQALGKNADEYKLPKDVKLSRFSTGIPGTKGMDILKEGMKVGEVVYTKGMDNTIYIDNIEVDEAFQKQGIASGVIQNLLKKEKATLSPSSNLTEAGAKLQERFLPPEASTKGRQNNGMSFETPESKTPIKNLVDPEELLPANELVLDIKPSDKSMTTGPIEVVKTKFGEVILDGRHRVAEAVRTGSDSIDTKQLSPEEALAKYGEEWPHLSQILPPGTKPAPGIKPIVQRNVGPKSANEVLKFMSEVEKNNAYKEFQKNNSGFSYEEFIKQFENDIFDAQTGKPMEIGGTNTPTQPLRETNTIEEPQKYYRVVAGDAVDSVKANGLEGDAKAAYNIAQGPKEGNLNYFNTKEEALNYARANHAFDSKVALVEVDAPKTGDTTALGGTSIPKSESKITAITDLTPEKNEFGGVTGMREGQNQALEEFVNILNNIKQTNEYQYSIKATGGDENRAIARVLQQNIEDGRIPEKVTDFIYANTPSVRDVETGELLNPLDGIRGHHVSNLLENITRNDDVISSKIYGQNEVLTPVQEAPETLINSAREQISKLPKKPEVSWREAADKFYTQWVDRFHPIEKVAKAVEGSLKEQNASLRPENNPKYQIRRFLGVGGIAEAKFKEGVEPVLKQLDEQGIDKLDMDAYLKARRDVGFGQVGRDIKGSDPVKAQATVDAFEAKYGAEKLQTIATQLYDHQNKLFDELVDAGFMRKDVAERIRAANPDYVPFERVLDDEALEDYLGIPTKKVVQGSKPVDKSIEGSYRDIYSPIESIIANTYKYTAAVEKNKVAQSVIGLKEVMPEIGFRQVSEAGPGTIPVWVDGVKQHVEVGKDIAEAAKGLNEESMNVVLKVLQWPAKILRSGATGQNPEFMLPNVGRDQFEAALFSNYGYKPFLDYFRGLGHIMRKDITGSDEIVDMWMKSGASQDLTSMSGRQSIEEFFSQNKNKRKSIFGYMGDLLDFMGRYSEQPTRVGLFDRAYKATGNERLAMFESRDATLDFSRMGNKMQVANSIVPFLNVGIQGFDKLVRQIKDKPAVTMAKMGIYALAPQAAATMYNLVNHQEEYNEIDQWVKDTNLVLVKGRNENGTVDYITFPKANSMQPFMNPLDNFLSYMAGNDTETFKRLATNLISNTLPVVEGGSTLKEVGVHTVGKLIPQAFKPITENMINTSFFKYDGGKDEAKEIVPYYLKDKAPGDQSFKYTPSAYKAAGKILNISPLQLQNLAEGYFAGYAKLPVQFIELMNKTSKGEEVSPNEVSIVRRFVRQTYPSSNTSGKKQQAAETPLISQASAAEAIQTAPETALNRATDTNVTGNEDERNWFQKMFNLTPGSKESETQTLAIPESDKELEVVYKNAKSILDSYEEKKTKYKYGRYENPEKELADLEEDKAYADQIMAQIEEKYPDKIADMELKTYVSGAGANVDERAEWAYNSIKKLAETGDTDKVTEFIDKLWDEKVLTSGSKGVAAKILEEYGINVYDYGKDTKTSKDPAKKSSSAAAKKAEKEKQKQIDSFFQNAAKQPKLGGNFSLPKSQVNWGATATPAPISFEDAKFFTKAPELPTNMEQFFAPKKGQVSFAEAQDAVNSVRGKGQGDSRLKLRYSR